MQQPARQSPPRQFMEKAASQPRVHNNAQATSRQKRYAPFEPTDFKHRCSLVNPTADEREQLKLPVFVRDLRVENGGLVSRPK